MPDLLFISSLFFYLLSIIGSLLLFLFNKHVGLTFTKVLIGLHLSAALAYFALRLLLPPCPSWISLFFWCSGILLAGIVVRKQFHWTSKAYFLFFLITIPVFIVLPSRIVNMVGGKKFGNIGDDRYWLMDNYFIVRTGEPLNDNGASSAKLVREMGFFHKTLAKNIPIPSKLDSVKLIGSIDDSLRASLIFYIESESDTLNLSKYKPQVKSNQITRKPSAP
ncbi:MAG: hypothetical protein ACK5C5_01250 [Bacteroidota bacterium]|jgi:hypothetical protein